MLRIQGGPMFKRKVFFFFCALALVSYSHAQEASSSQHSFRVGSLIGLQNYELQGTGFNTSSSAANGKGLDGSWHWQNNQKTYVFKALSYRTSASSSGSISPRDVTSDLKIYHLGLVQNMGSNLSSLVSFADEFKFGLGLQWRERSSDATTPNRFFPHYQTMGFHLGLAGQKAWSSMWKLESAIGLYIPYLFDERSEKTGYLKWAFMPDAEINFVYKVNPFIDFSFGVRALYESLSYSGTGARGVSDAKETYLNLIFPLELRFSF